MCGCVTVTLCVWTSASALPLCVRGDREGLKVCMCLDVRLCVPLRGCASVWARFSGSTLDPCPFTCLGCLYLCESPCLCVGPCLSLCGPRVHLCGVYGSLVCLCVIGVRPLCLQVLTVPVPLGWVWVSLRSCGIVYVLNGRHGTPHLTPSLQQSQRPRPEQSDRHTTPEPLSSADPDT